MKRKLCLVLFITSILFSSCSAKHNPLEAGDELVNEPGTVKQLSSNPQWFVIVPDFDHTIRFLPSNLPNKLKRDGIRVIFSGEIGEIPAKVRLIGIPLDLTNIKQIEQSNRYSHFFLLPL